MSTAAKRIPIVLSILLAAMLAAALAPQPALAEGAQVIASGACGSCTWELRDGALTIRPTTGNSGTLEGGSPWPWSEHRLQIRSVEVEAGVKAGQDASLLFEGCENLASADLSNLGVSGTRSLERMFGSCGSLKSLDLSRWDVSSVEDMAYMFIRCSSLASLDLSGWDTSSATDMHSMFSGCSSLASLDLSGWDTSSATDMKFMFYNCLSLATIKAACAADWSGKQGTDMFSGCTSLAGGYGTVYDGEHEDSSYARVDGLAGEPGYFTTIHEVMETINPATPARDGAITGNCNICQVALSATIPRPMSFALSESSFTYDGTPKQPDVTVRDKNGREIAASNYDVEYAGNTNVGTATATVTFKGGLYMGTNQLAFTIAKAEILAPSANTGLAYTGNELVGVPAGWGYTVSGGSATEAGPHTATVSLKDTANTEWSDGTTADKRLTFTIAKAAISPEVSIEGWTYGEAAKHPALGGGSNPGDGAVAFEYKPRGSGDGGYAADVPSSAGSYTVRATVAETANHLGGSATADFSIAKAKVPIPEAKTGLVYSGEEQTGVEEGPGYTVVGGSATAAGSHTATASLVDKANTQWADETADDKVIPFEIASPEVAIPKAKAGLVYNGKSQTGVEEGPGYTVSGGSATNAGSHTATASLVDKANAKWSDGTTEDKEVAFTIAKAKVAVPKAKSGLVYNGKSQTGVPAGAGYAVKGGSAKAAGSYKATLTADANHVFSTGKATAAVAWSIAKAKGAVAAKAKSSKPVAIAAGKPVLATKALKVTKNASGGKVTYKKVKGDKGIAVKNGRITVKKGLKKGTYTIKVKATSAATANYKAATSKAVALKIRVK